MSVYNLLKMMQAKNYVPNGNDLWFFYYPPVIKNDEFELIGCGTSSFQNKIDEAAKRRPIMTIRELTLAWDNGWSLILAFLCLISVVIWNKLNRSKSRA